jgi:hypothetical protein
MKRELSIIERKRQELAPVEQGLKDVITHHSDYVDPSGNKSSGAKGLALQINIRIKKAFSEDRDSFTYGLLQLLIALLEHLTQVIKLGELNHKTRKEIKREVYQSIEDFGVLAGKIA